MDKRESVDQLEAEMVNSSAKTRKKKENRKKKKMKNKKSSLYGCFRSDLGHPVVEESDVHGNFDMESVSSTYSKDPDPTHLIVTVNGIIGSAHDWRFAAKQFLKKYPEYVLVHCSECNHSTLTFDGVDVMGSRLADEVISVIKHHPELEKISFIGHSLGGLIARYAITKLYGPDYMKQVYQENGELDKSNNPLRDENVKGLIAGLEPMNFITSATPHLGLRGHKQVPMFCGFHALEKFAKSISWLLGRTGEHQFLTDSDDGKPPLLLQMAQDCEDLKFISALQSFKRRVAYANAHYDYVVGWSTSSLRRQHELPKQHLSGDNRYPHIINEDIANLGSSYKEAQVCGNENDDMEEAMLNGLTQASWERVDVSFCGSKQRFFAHSTIQVKTPSMHSDGADVIQHMVDKFLL